MNAQTEEVNFRSRILKFRSRLQKPWSFEVSVGYKVIKFHHFPCDSSENYLFSIFVLFFPYKKVTKNEETIVKENSENDEEHNDENGEDNEEKNDVNALKIVYSGIQIWFIDFRSVKWSGYIRISDNPDIRTSTLDLTQSSCTQMFIQP